MARKRKKAWKLHKAREIKGLQQELRIGHRKEKAYPYLVFIDDSGRIKWKIFPNVNHNNRIASLSVYHRNNSKGFHSQNISEWGTDIGLRNCVNKIADHEDYEREDYFSEEDQVPKEIYHEQSG